MTSFLNMIIILILLLPEQIREFGFFSIGVLFGVLVILLAGEKHA